MSRESPPTPATPRPQCCLLFGGGIGTLDALCPIYRDALAAGIVVVATKMIELVQQWYAAHQHELSERGIGNHLTIGPGDRPKRAIWVDVETDKRLARLVVWQTGESELESADLRDERPTVAHLTLASSADLEAALARLVDLVR